MIYKICRINKMGLLEIIRQNEQQELMDRLAARSVVLDAELISVVSSIIDDVRARGDRALIDYTKRFDKVELTQLRVNEEELRRCAERVDERVLRALREAISNVTTFHERQLEESWTISR